MTLGWSRVLAVMLGLTPPGGAMAGGNAGADDDGHVASALVGSLESGVEAVSQSFVLPFPASDASFPSSHVILGGASLRAEARWRGLVRAGLGVAGHVRPVKRKSVVFDALGSGEERPVTGTMKTTYSILRFEGYVGLSVYRGLFTVGLELGYSGVLFQTHRVVTSEVTGVLDGEPKRDFTHVGVSDSVGSVIGGLTVDFQVAPVLSLRFRVRGQRAQVVEAGAGLLSRIRPMAGLSAVWTFGLG